MNKKFISVSEITKQFVRVRQEPSLLKNSAGRSRGIVDGLNLQEVDRKGILAFSLCREYSRKQHRRIRRLRIKKTRYGHGNRKLSILRRIRHLPTRKQLIIKQVFDGGARPW